MTFFNQNNFLTLLVYKIKFELIDNFGTSQSSTIDLLKSLKFSLFAQFPTFNESCNSIFLIVCKRGGDYFLNRRIAITLNCYLSHNLIQKNIHITNNKYNNIRNKIVCLFCLHLSASDL